MKIGTLVKHIEWEYIGVVMQQGVGLDCDKWLIHFNDGVTRDRWCTECELEALCR